MPNPNLYPLLMQPTLHTKVWGGRQLETVLHKQLPTDEPYGESWEVHDTSVIANGVFAGKKLSELLPVYGRDLLGAANDPALGVPLLAKFLDASDWLSIQVHPNDAQARQLEGEPRGKTEAWYVLAAEPGAKLVVGVRPGTAAAEIARAIHDNQLEKLLMYAEVVPGDVLFIPAGTIHALGPGILIYEIQQSSDTTYRLYDWGRMGLDGQPRALHVEKSITVAQTTSLPGIRHTAHDESQTVEIVSSDFFTTLLHKLNGDSLALTTDGKAFHLLTCVEGALEVSADGVTVPVALGESVFIPASTGEYTLSGSGSVLRSFQW